MRLISVSALVLSLVAPGHALEDVTVTPVTTRSETASGQPITLPQNDVRVVASIFDIAPGASLPVHKHPFARYAFVTAGQLEVIQTETGKGTVYSSGDFIVEMIDEWHHARNVGSEPVRLLVIDQIAGEVENTLLRAMQ